MAFRIAETLRDHFATAGSAEPELLAHHFTQAGLTELQGPFSRQVSEANNDLPQAPQLRRAALARTCQMNAPIKDDGSILNHENGDRHGGRSSQASMSANEKTRGLRLLIMVGVCGLRGRPMKLSLFIGAEHRRAESMAQRLAQHTVQP